MGSFNPEQTLCMLLAFEDAWRSLQESGDVLAAEFRAPSTREHLAKAIIELVRSGELDPGRLKANAIAVLSANVPLM